MRKRRGIGAWLLILGIGAACARDWNFSKDTVYEWASNGDAASISNQGSIQLQFDSLIMELVRPTPVAFEVYFEVPAVHRTYIFSSHPEYVAANQDLHTIQVPVGQSVTVQNFAIDDYISRLAKRAIADAVGDTMLGRLIFRATGGRGQDTLMVMGLWQGVQSSLHPVLGSHSKTVGSGEIFDPLGRTRKPEMRKAFFAPLLSPGN